MNNPFLDGMNAGQVYQHIARLKRTGGYTEQVQAWEKEFYALDSATAPSGAAPALKQARAAHISSSDPLKYTLSKSKSTREQSIDSLHEAAQLEASQLIGIDELTPEEDFNLGQILGELQSEGEGLIDNATTDGSNYLDERYKQFDRVGIDRRFAREFEKLDDIPNLPAGARLTPQEWRETLATGGESRVATEYRNNSVTGIDEVVPSSDPTSGKGRKPLNMFLGTRDQAARVPKGGSAGKAAKDMLGIPNASEYVQRQILRRRGEKAHMNNASGDPTVTDFAIDTGDGIELVDGQTFSNKWTDSPNPQAYTAIVPGYKPPGTTLQQDINELNIMIQRDINANPTSDLQSIVNNNPYYESYPGKPAFEGKLLDSGARHKKDRILYTEYPQALHRAGRNANDTIAMAPKDLWEHDIDIAKKEFKNLVGDDLKRSVRVKPPAGGARIPQIDIEVPEEMESKFRRDTIDILRDKPEVKQFMDYKQRPLLTPIPMDEIEARGKPKVVTNQTRPSVDTQTRPAAGTRVKPRASGVPKSQAGYVNSSLLDPLVEGSKGLWKGRLGGLGTVALNGSSRELGEAIGRGDARGATLAFGLNYAGGAVADRAITKTVGSTAARKAGQAILTKLPGVASRFIATSTGGAGFTAPYAAAYSIYELADGGVEAATGKGLSKRMEEASDDAVTRAYERKWNQPAPKGGFVPKDKPLVQEKPQRAPSSLENINSAVKAVSEIAPEVKAQPAQITQAKPQVDKPDTGNFLSQWTNKVRSWFK
jgi:hypothetical protein